MTWWSHTPGEAGALLRASMEKRGRYSPGMYNRFTSETAAGADSADLMWSSAMDLQMKLVSDGQAMTYASPEASALPATAVYQNQAFGTTLEPFAFIYNKRLLPDDAVP